MKSLIQLSIRSSSRLRKKRVLPIELGYEERRAYWDCPQTGACVTAFTCLQCCCFEVNSELTRKVVRETGNCKYPKKASRGSRKITRWSPFGESPKERTVRGGFKRKKGGMSDKIDFAVGLVHAGRGRQEVITGLLNKYPTMSKAYAATVQYKAMKEVKG